jgi:hypothetical protein
MMDMHTKMREQARLIILKALAEQVNETLNSDLLVQHLPEAGIFKDRAWLHGELDYLADLDAISQRTFGTIRVATLTEKGARHLARELVIEGVQRPSRPGG